MDYYSGAGHYDRETVRFFDVAHEGAQLRAVAGALPQIERLGGIEPRSLVVIATDQLAAAVARAAVALCEPHKLPVCVADQLPAYVGPLDVVLIVGERATRESDSRALITASGRGAEVLLAGPARGPLLNDAPATTTTIPALPTAAGPSPARTIAAVTAVYDVIAGSGADAAARLEAIAEQVDSDLAALSPEREESVNPARQLRAFAADSLVAHSAAEVDGLVGSTAVGRAVAAVAAELWSARGLVSGFVAPEEMPLDQFQAGEFQLVPLKTVLWALPGAAAEAASAAPNTRAESVEDAGLGPVAQCVRLVTRAYAVTAFDPPAEEMWR
ncbi:hypothetical protein V6D40_02255 [Corynebacterium sp. Q4381]|uniref:hypothetical protein n=1 Tax=Corynebacterium sp. Marseille-Q4381 TaxID=3121597 RepID=UPI002FE57FB8